MIKTSRSKIVSAHHCRRYRFLKYHFEGVGLELVSGSLPAFTGQIIHDVFRDISNKVDFETAIREGNAKLAKGMTEAAPGHPNLPHEILEQTYVMEGMIRAFHRVRQPLIDEEFDLIFAEKELEWELAPGVFMPLRLDRLERRKSDGLLFIRDFKTTSMAGMDWVRKWERDHQILAYCQAAEELMGEPIGGMIIEGLVRGKKRKDKGQNALYPGIRIQQTPFAYIYQSDSGELSPTYQRGKAWHKTALWDVPMSPKEWIEERLTREDVSELFIAPVPAISPNKMALARWRRQHGHLETILDIHARQVNERIQDKVQWLTAIDMLFPQNQDACYKFGEDYPCEFDQICYNGQVEEDPIASGLYAPRKDHHGGEEG
jgi:hypothetical protein